MTAFSVRQIKAGGFCFHPDDRAAVSPEKYKGLARYGPFRPLAAAPQIGFVFPNELLEDARRLFTALRSGAGLFKGCASLLQFDVSRDNVSRISGFSLPMSTKVQDHAACYADAILSWKAKATSPVDIFVVLHAKSARWEDDTPYYLCKGQLLKNGVVSQHVTPELLRNPRQFEWSAAEIALQMFVKLGGIPWITRGEAGNTDVIIGVGRTERRDEKGGVRRLMGFTTCVRAEGPFLFSQLGGVAEWGPQYLRGLSEAVENTVRRCLELPEKPRLLAVHMSKELGRQERDAIQQGLNRAGANGAGISAVVLKVTHEEDLFAVEEGTPDGSPRRGTCVRIGEQDFLVYTEGREDTRSWQFRTPTGIQVRVYGEQPPAVVAQLVRQVFDLAQVDYRGFRASSEPASMKYSRLMTSILSHLPPNDLLSIAAAHDSALSTRMWFL